MKTAWSIIPTVGLAIALVPFVTLAQMPPPVHPASPVAVDTQPAATQQAAEAPGKSSESPGPHEPAPDKLSVTTGQINVHGQVIHYTATTGYLPQKDETGKLKANIFFVAYTRDAEKPVTSEPASSTTTQPAAADRPITFLFNGGPGAASVWLHLGAAGPKRVTLDDNGDAPAPPFALEDNPECWLDLTDLVFIDPVGTGYSRAAPGEDPKAFWGVSEDLDSVGEFIRLYCTRYERWNSPKFLAGESYGTTRAAALSDFLADRFGISVNGVVLISCALNFQTFQPSMGNDLPFALYLPSYAADAWYHKKLAPDLQADLQKTLQEAKHFALNQYATALTKGDALTDADRSAVLDQLVRFTGLSRDYLDKSNLRVYPQRFCHMLLNDQRLVIGRFDPRLTGADTDATNDSAEFDPSFPQFFSAYTSLMSDYVRRTLKYDNDLPYETLTGKVHPWNFGPAGNGYLNVTDNLQSAIVKNPKMKVLVASGYFDLATPFASTDYTIDHLNLPKNLRGNITQTYYLGGHMLYHPKSQLEKLHKDLAAFYEAADGRTGN